MSIISMSPRAGPEILTGDQMKCNFTLNDIMDFSGECKYKTKWKYNIIYNIILRHFTMEMYINLH